MKYKFIILLAVLLTGGVSASPNRYCGGARCTGKPAKPVTITPAKVVTLMIDDVELLPMHQYFSNI